MLIQCRHEAIGRARVLRRTPPNPGEAHGNVSRRGSRQNLLDPNVVYPVRMKVVFVAEALVRPKIKLRQSQPMSPGEKVQATFAWHAIPLTANGEPMLVLVRPTHGQLNGLVQLGNSAIRRHQDPAPDRRTDAAQLNAQLVDLPQYC